MPFSALVRQNKVMLLVLGLFSAYFALAYFANPFYAVFSPGNYLVMHNITEAFSIIVSLLIFAITWHSHYQAKDSRSLFLGVVFLAIGLIDIFHALSYNGMPDFVTPNSVDKAAQFWIAARLLGATAFLGSYFVKPDSDSLLLKPLPLLAASLAVSAGVFASIILLPGSFPTMFVPGEGLTELKVNLEYVIIVMKLLAAALYLYQYGRTLEEHIPFFVAAMVLSVFSELFFTMYASAYDTYNLLGHLYKAGAFFFIYQMLFTTSVKKPYLELEESREELEEYAARLEERVASRTKSLADKNRQLEDLNRLKTDFLAMCSHDMKTPLQSSMLLIELLLEGYDGDLTPEQAESIKTLQKNEQELYSLITNLLDLARLESGNMELNTSKVDINSLLTAWAEKHRLISQKKRLSFTVEPLYAPDCPMFELDPFKINQVLNNLMSNALKFTPAGGVIRLSASPEGAGCGMVISLFNSGPAIPEEELGDIFRKFGRSGTKGRKKKEGTGLGLSIAKSIVELHGGRMWAESVDGVGNTISFTLPTSPPAAAHVQVSGPV